MRGANAVIGAQGSVEAVDTDRPRRRGGGWAGGGPPPDVAAIDHALRAFLDAQPLPTALRAALAYATGLDSDDRRHRGKRVRPRLCLSTCMALGGTVARAMPFAVACELLHTFVLIHDDVEDGDQMRRGRAAVHRRFGLAGAVNLGDLCHVLAHRAVLAAGWDVATRQRLLTLANDALFETGLGQAQDLEARHTRISRAAYLDLAQRKTGAYLALPLLGGATLAGASAPVITAIEAFASRVGPMFQIVDDIIDLVGGKGRDARGSDLREGKASLPTVIAFERADADQRRALLGILRAPRERTTDDDVARAMVIFEALDVIAEARRVAFDLGEQARRGLSQLPAPLATRLDDITGALLGRDR